MTQSIYYPDIKTSFTKICPYLEHLGKDSTIQKQLQILRPPGLTIIARIERTQEVPFKEAIEKIQTRSGRRFCSSKCLHFTLLGLFNDKRMSNQIDKDEIIRSATAFIKRTHFRHVKINFNLVRPGAFYTHGGPCDYISDGMLVAMADNRSKEVNEFNLLGDDLACHLRQNFPSIFYPSIYLRLKREHPTVWSTVGYFEEPDFDIDRALATILEEFKSFNAVVTVSQLEVRSYTLRSLENSELVATIDL